MERNRARRRDFANATATTLFAALASASVAISDSRKILINRTLNRLSSSGWLARLDRFCMPRAENQGQGLYDWVTAAPYTVTGTMTFAANDGLTGDGSTGYIDTGLAPSAATHFTLNKAMFGVALTNTRSVGAVMCAMGTSSDNAGECRIYPAYTGNQSFTSINGQFTNATPTPPTVHGIYMENRPDSANMVFYRNTTVLRDDARAATSLDTATFLVGATRTAGVAADFSTDTIGGFWIGDGATGDADQAVLQVIINDYLAQIGTPL